MGVRGLVCAVLLPTCMGRQRLRPLGRAFGPQATQEAPRMQLPLLPDAVCQSINTS